METDDIEKMMKMFKIIRMMNGNNDNTIEKKDNNKEIKEEIKKEKKEDDHIGNYIIPFDEEIQTPAIKTIKAAIPYLEYKYQKNMGIMVKIIELDNLIKKYKDISSSGKNNDESWRKNMLISIRKYTSKDKQPIIDMIIKIMDINDIMKVLKESGNNNGNN